MKQDKCRIIIEEIFRIVMICMYITHSKLHLSHYNLILIYEFATNRNCAEPMRKAFQLLRPSFACVCQRTIFSDPESENPYWHIPQISGECYNIWSDSRRLKLKLNVKISKMQTLVIQLVYWCIVLNHALILKKPRNSCPIQYCSNSSHKFNCQE